MRKLAMYSGWVFSIVLVGVMFFGWNYTNEQLRTQSSKYTDDYAVLNATYQSLRTDYNTLSVHSANVEAYYNSYIVGLNQSFNQQQAQWTDTLNTAMSAKDAQFASTLNLTMAQRDAFWNTTLANTLAARDATWQSALNATIALNNATWNTTLNNALIEQDAAWRNWAANQGIQLP